MTATWMRETRTSVPEPSEHAVFADEAFGQLDLGLELSHSVGFPQLPLGFRSLEALGPAGGVYGGHHLEAVLRRRPAALDPADRPLEPTRVIGRDFRLCLDDLEWGAGVG